MTIISDIKNNSNQVRAIYALVNILDEFVIQLCRCYGSFIRTDKTFRYIMVYEGKLFAVFVRMLHYTSPFGLIKSR